MTVPIISRAAVLAAVPPQDAYDAVSDAFVAYHRGDWTMPPKVYVTNYPAGDFRAMPALGGGHALLKWVTSFPGNLARGLPTVTGLVLLSNAETGALEAVLDGAAVTALRTAAAAVLAVDTLAAATSSVAVVGCGANGAETARMLGARGVAPILWDVDPGRRASVAEAVGGRVADSLEHALRCDAVITVTPGHEVLYGPGSLLPGQHVSLMGADGPGKAEVAVEELARGRLFCDDWEQASHGGELTGSGRRRRGDAGRRDDAGRGPRGRCRGSSRRRGDDALRLDRTRDPGPCDCAPGVPEVGRARPAAPRPLTSGSTRGPPEAVDGGQRLCSSNTSVVERKRQPSSRAGSNRSRSGSRSPRSARATRRPQANPSTLPWPEYPPVTQARSNPGTGPTTGRKSSTSPKIPAQR